MNELTTEQQTTALAEAGFFGTEDGAGLGNIESTDLIIPYLKMAQTTSPECKEANADKFMPDLKPGMFYSSVTRRIYSVYNPQTKGYDVKLSLVKEMLHQYEVYESEDWTAKKPEEKWVGRIDVSEFRRDVEPYGHKDGGYTYNDKLRYQEIYAFCVLPVDFPEDGPMIFIMKSYSRGGAKSWLTGLNSVRRNGVLAGIYTSEWLVSSVVNPDDEYSNYFIPRVTRIDWVRPELRGLVLSLFNAHAGKEIAAAPDSEGSASKHSTPKSTYVFTGAQEAAEKKAADAEPDWAKE